VGEKGGLKRKQEGTERIFLGTRERVLGEGACGRSVFVRGGCWASLTRGDVIQKGRKKVVPVNLFGLRKSSRKESYVALTGWQEVCRIPHKGGLIRCSHGPSILPSPEGERREKL